MRTFVFASAALLASCSAPPQELASSSNAEIEVGLLTTFEDCRVYRFTDGGRHVYIARCGGDHAQSFYRETFYCGKGCIQYRNHQAVTVQSP